jgi:SPASM domain peptide maturase of grasp-with-spasm system
MSKKYFKLFDSNFIVWGNRNVLIFAHHCQNYISLPIEIFLYIQGNEKVEDISKNFSNDISIKLLSILDCLTINNFGYYYKLRNDVYGSIQPNINFNFPSIISNILIDFSDLICRYQSKIVIDINEININYLQIRIFEAVDFEKLFQILDSFKNSSVISIVLSFNYNDNELFVEYFQKMLKLFKKIVIINVYNFTEDYIYYDKENLVKIAYKIKTLKDVNECGFVDLEKFNATIYSYSEALYHNSCLNRKISIDAEGNIKNCPSMSESFGNIRDTTLHGATEKSGFKKYWDINKDKIHVCKDCEYRYICTDCRAYVEDPEDIFSKPLKCGYNPYTGEWSKWSTNPLKQKAIDFYGMMEMVDEMNKADIAG